MMGNKINRNIFTQSDIVRWDGTLSGWGSRENPRTINFLGFDSNFANIFKGMNGIELQS
jgi:hypothetical protein